jgi:hypothetical protein
VITNVAQLSFVICPTGTTPQTATQLAIFSAVSAGTKLHQQTMTNNLTIAAAHQPIVPVGYITITSDEQAF